MSTDSRPQWIIPAVLGAIMLAAFYGIFLQQESDQEYEQEKVQTSLEVTHKIITGWIDDQRHLVSTWAHFPEVVVYADELNRLPLERRALVKQPARLELKAFFSPLVKSGKIDRYTLVDGDGYIRASSSNSLLAQRSGMARLPAIFSPLWQGKKQWVLPYNNPEPSRNKDGVYVRNQPHLLIAAPVMSGHGMSAALIFAVNSQRELHRILAPVISQNIQAMTIISGEKTLFETGKWVKAEGDVELLDWVGPDHTLEYRVLYRSPSHITSMQPVYILYALIILATLAGILASRARAYKRYWTGDGSEFVGEVVFAKGRRAFLILDSLGQVVKTNARARELLSGNTDTGKKEMQSLLLELTLNLQTEDGYPAPEFAMLLKERGKELFYGIWRLKHRKYNLSCRFTAHEDAGNVLVEINDITDSYDERNQLRRRSQALDHAAELVFWVNKEGRLVYLNKTATSVLGYSPVELESFALKDIDAALSDDGWSLIWGRVRRGEEVQHEAALVKKTGSSFPAETHMSFYSSRTDSFVCIFARDITHKKQLEADLYRSRMQLTDKLSITSKELEAREEENKALLESIPDLLLVMNSRFEVMHFQQPVGSNDVLDIVIGQTLFDSFALDNVVLEQALNKEGRYFTEIQRISGPHYQFLELRMTRASDNRISALVRDITERKQQEHLRQFHNHLLSSLTTMQTRFICDFDKKPDFEKQLTDLMSLVGAGYGVCLLTEPLSCLLGMSECYELTDPGYDWLSEDCRLLIIQWCQDRLHQWYTHSSHIGPEIITMAQCDFPQHCRPDNPALSPGLIILPILVGDDIQMSFTILLQDIRGWNNSGVFDSWIATCAALLAGYENDRERVRAEQNLLIEKDRAEVASQAKTDFLSRMSHEFRTPLNAILGFSQLMGMDQENLNEEQADHLFHIEESGQKILKLVDDILELSQMENKELEVNLQDVNLSAVVQDLLPELADSAEQKEITLSTNLSSEAISIHGDPERLKQVVHCLIDNAIQYNQPGGFVTVDLVSGDRNCELVVTDGGQGIEPDFLDKIFMPFETAEGLQSQGVGNGLAVARHLVELMQGSISVTSEPDKGSCFTVSFPVIARITDVIKPFMASVAPQEAFAGLASEPTDSQSDDCLIESDCVAAECFDVLYIEDEQAGQRLVSQVIEKVNRDGGAVELRLATNAEQGIEQFLDKTPDMVLLDMHLHDVSGIDVLEAIRSLGEGQDVPVIALSGDVEQDAINQALESGFDDYLCKPVDVSVLISVIQRYMN